MNLIKLLAVNLNTKNHEPRYPPRIVFNWVDANHGLYICIVENIIIASIDDNTKETDVVTAAAYYETKKQWIKINFS